jgi:hypothetical protein
MNANAAKMRAHPSPPLALILQMLALSLQNAIRN